MSTRRGGTRQTHIFVHFRGSPMRYHGRILVPSSSNQTSLGCRSNSLSSVTRWSCHILLITFYVGLVWAREHCRISPPHFLAACREKRLNQGSFVLLCFVLFAFSGLSLVFVVSVFDCLLSLIFQRVPAEWHIIA